MIEFEIAVAVTTLIANDTADGQTANDPDDGTGE